MRWQLIITFFRKLLFVKLSKSEMIEKCYNVKPDMGATIVYNICMTCTMRNSCDWFCKRYYTAINNKRKLDINHEHSQPKSHLFERFEILCRFDIYMYVLVWIFEYQYLLIEMRLNFTIDFKNWDF